MTKDLLKTLRDILKKNLTSEAGSAILEQMSRSKSNLEDKMVVVSVYNKTEEDSWLPFAKPLHEFSFAPHEYELAVETMQTYDADEFDVSIMFGNISKDTFDISRGLYTFLVNTLVIPKIVI